MSSPACSAALAREGNRRTPSGFVLEVVVLLCCDLPPPPLCCAGGLALGCFLGRRGLGARWARTVAPQASHADPAGGDSTSFAYSLAELAERSEASCGRVKGITPCNTPKPTRGPNGRQARQTLSSKRRPSRGRPGPRRALLGPESAASRGPRRSTECNGGESHRAARRPLARWRQAPSCTEAADHAGHERLACPGPKQTRVAARVEPPPLGADQPTQGPQRAAPDSPKALRRLRRCLSKVAQHEGQHLGTRTKQQNSSGEQAALWRADRRLRGPMPLLSRSPPLHAHTHESRIVLPACALAPHPPWPSRSIGAPSVRTCR